MSKLYYWRKSRIGRWHVVFTCAEDRAGISAYVMPLGEMWLWRVRKPFHVAEATEETLEQAKEKAEKLINYEFRPENLPYFG